VRRALSTLARRGTVADGIFADPPYGKGFVDRTLEAVVASGVLRKGGWVAIEHAVGEAPAERPGLSIEVQRRYGSTVVSVLHRDGNEQEERR